ncbi:hypothetical protein OFC56_34675, partial [Escherichia coli]|nr:hypothetical protein [Escherichia coli]
DQNITVFVAGMAETLDKVGVNLWAIARYKSDPVSFSMHQTRVNTAHRPREIFELIPKYDTQFAVRILVSVGIN